MTTSATPIELPTRSTAPPKTRVRRTTAQWKALLEEYASSGLTQTAFCQKHHIAPSSLCKWQKYFANQPATSGFIEITESLTKTPLPLADCGPDGPWQVELELGPGVVLRVRTL